MKQPLLQSLDDLALPVYVSVCTSKRQPGASLSTICTSALAVPCRGFSIQGRAISLGSNPSRFVLAALLFSLPLFLQAQSLSSQVFGSAGGAVLQNGVRVNWTLGEAAVSRVYAENGKGSVTEGFHQPALQVKPVADPNRLQVTLAPNPVLSVLNLNLPATIAAEVSATLADAQGNVVLNRVPLKPGSTELDLSLFPAGMYFLTIRQADQPSGQTYKVVKLK
jgi:hypothetical protein